MWQILKAEFWYTRDSLVVAYTIAVIFLIGAVTTDNWGIYNYMSNTTMVYFILMWILGTSTISEKRYRFHSTLPVTAQQLAIADGLYILFVQSVMFLLWVLCLLFRRESVSLETVWVMFANSAMSLSVITIFGIHYHLGFFGTRNYKLLHWGVWLTLLSIAVILERFGQFKAAARFLWSHYATAYGALSIVLLCAALSVLSARLFVRRKSYLA